MKNGFSLLELLVVIGIIIFLAVLTLPVSTSFYYNQSLNKSTDQTIWLLRQAQGKAMDQKNDSAFGVYLRGSQLTMFQGANYQDRQAAEDIVYNYPQAIGFSGLAEIIFAKGSGLPNNPGNISLNLGNSSRQINLNNLGLISY